MARSTTEWTLTELAAQVALILSQSPITQSSNRVTKVPNPRTIRYYSTLGLLDPPLRMRGRTALYGAQHLRQLVAVKSLQARGYDLEEIKETLPRLEEAGLRRLLAKLAQQEAGTGPRVELEAVVGMRLDAEALLLVEGPLRALQEDDVEAIRVAATPLLKLLRARRLL